MTHSIIILGGDQVEKQKIDETYNGLVQELKRGNIILSILSQLKTPQYGYSLVISLEEKKVPVEPGTLYPLLRRLEKQNILESTWVTDTSKPRKYYKLSENGKIIYDKLYNEWLEINKNMEKILKS